MSKYKTPEMPYVQAKHQGGKQKPTVIILRPSFTDSFGGAALAVAQNWHRNPSFWEAGHYCVDEKTRFRCVPDKVIAGIEDTEKGAIRIAICADPITGTQFWDLSEHIKVLNKAAELVAELTLAYNINVAYLDDTSKARWSKIKTRRRGGIFVEETSGWPFTSFINEVKAQRALKTHI